jgi:hypothetical protein
MTTTEKDHNNAALRDRLAQLVQDVIDGVESPAAARKVISAAIVANRDLAEFGQVCLSQIEGADEVKCLHCKEPIPAAEADDMAKYGVAPYCSVYCSNVAGGVPLPYSAGAMVFDKWHNG